MKSKLLIAAAGVALLLAAFKGTEPSEKHRGVSWVGGRTPVTEAELRPLREAGVEWIVQTPFGWQRRFDSPGVRLNKDARWWGESDQGLRETTRLASRLDLKTLLKPHIWVARGEPGKWRSDIRHTSEEAWRQWFDSYRDFILHYARLAREEGVEALCVGTELHGTVGREREWREVIAAVREVYGGRLTYAANWWSEYKEVPFWDALDYIGVQAYFPLSSRERPTIEQLKRGWKPHAEELERFAATRGKPLLFTEIGYRSVPDAAIEPWKWPQHSERREVDLQTQANAYEAFFQTFWKKDWFAGAYFWKWYPRPRGRRGADVDFTPQHKPAEKVIRRWYKAR